MAAQETLWSPTADVVVDTSVFNAAERRAWAPPPRLKPSEWAEQFRVLQPGQSNQPGPWRNSAAPYLAGFMDLAGAVNVNQLNVMKGGQEGFSEACRNLLAMWAHIDPDPCGLTLPDKEKGHNIVNNRIIPMFETTACLRSLFTKKACDIRQGQIKLLNGFLMHLMWARSPSSTSSDPMRRVINDEVDKAGFSAWGGGEPAAVSRTWKRLRTYGDRKLQINLSTPTNQSGVIYNLFVNSSVQLYWMVACPICRHRQRLSFRQLRWKKLDAKADLAKQAATIMAENAVWYECSDCGGAITSDMKKAMIRGGYYGTVDGRITHAEDIAEWPRGTTIGIHVGALNCLWEEWSDMVSEFILATNDPAKMFNFRTETLGEPWEESVDRTTPSVYSAKCKRAALAEGVVPKWAARLLATVDTQHDHFYGVIRAWGPEMRSQRVWHGRLETFAEVEKVCMQQAWRCETTDRPPMRPYSLLIDSGGTKLEGDVAGRTMQVYAWANRHRGMVRPVKGASKPRDGQFMWEGKGYLGKTSRSRKGRPSVRLWLLDTNHFQDLLATLIEVGTQEGDDPATERWLLNKRNDDEYNWHMANMHKTMVQAKSGLLEKWVPIEVGAPEHFRDCEVYQVASAYMAMIHQLPTMDAFLRHQDNEAKEHRRREERRRKNKEEKDPWAVKPLKM